MDTKIITPIMEELGITPKDPRTIPALTLAYLGDCIYELVIRSMLVERGTMHVSELSKEATGYVKASAQCEVFHKIEEHLDEEELAAYRRGRNAKSGSIAKNATVADYRMATGFEALMGWLYVQDRVDRILELLKYAI